MTLPSSAASGSCADERGEEQRNATSMGITDIADIIRRKNSVVTVFQNRDSAEHLQQRLIDIGAKVKVNTREVVAKNQQN